MLYYILYPLKEYFSLFNVVRYISFRGGCAFVCSFLIVMLSWRFVLPRLRRLQFIERVDMYGHVYLEALYQGKKGTPTMGGLLVIFSILVSTLLWARWNVFIWVVIFTLSGLGLVGLRDDYLKTVKGKGLSRGKKLALQILIGMLVGLFMVGNKNISTRLDLPFFKNLVLDLGYFYLFWVILVLVAASNAVNFTDGLDGLAIGALITNALFFSFLSYLSGHIKFAQYLFIPYFREAPELVVFCLALAGAGLGFLWFNAYPAEVFMGDVGALSLGGALGIVALLIKKEFLLILSGGLFVLEALSVILQIASVKLRRKRVFRAAPLHHHFQLLGWKESKIIIRFWIFSIICCVLGLLTLKLR